MIEENQVRDGLVKEFTETYMEKLFYFCLKKTGSNTEAEDLTQDISLNIIMALNKGAVPTHFSAWVWQIARNRYSAWADQKRKRNEALTGNDVTAYEIEDKDGNILDEMINAEQLSLLRRELAFVKRDYRDIVVAYYIENKSVREIASSLCLSISAVQQRLHRARIILKEGMDMARKFGKLSYNPEDITFISNGTASENGAPWLWLNRLLCKNILLAAYRVPATAEELAMEVGVALPYMEEELSPLVANTLMKKNGNKYETNFFIVSAEAQEKINAHLRTVTPAITNAIIKALEFKIDWRNQHCPDWHEGYQPYEDMKWALLMQETDSIEYLTINPFHRKAEEFPNIGSYGHTLRPMNGEWDILGLETYEGDRPHFVGLHGCSDNSNVRYLPRIAFQQFKFMYRAIADKTPMFLGYTEAEALVAIANGKCEEVNENILQYLQSYGYIKKTDSGYVPTFLVMRKKNLSQMPEDICQRYDDLRQKAQEVATQYYLFCREQIYKEIPDFLKDDEFQIDHACANIFTLRGAVLEEALRQGYLTYDETDENRMLGAFLTI